MKNPVSNRRSFLHHSAATAVAASLAHRLDAADAASGLKGHINHSACKWCYDGIPLEELCRAGKEIGLTSIDLVGPSDFPTLKKYDLTCAMIGGIGIQGPGGVRLGGIEKGFNRREYHDALASGLEMYIKATADFGAKHVIVFSGNREGLSDEDGLKICAEGLKKALPYAEKHGVTLVMELLNSRVNHRDYQCDKSAWGVELCKAVSSDHFKLLYDIYHMQIMEGDIIATIKRDHPYFAHYHTGGVPGRHEIDDSQELNYPAIMKAIVDTGFKGHVAQEFIPAKPDKLASLKQAVGLCDV
ncbi:MAG: hydroxypyruvate isomerase family protein [Verrucomicrobiales bacterium]